MRLRLFLLPILLAALASAQTAGFTTTQSMQNETRATAALLEKLHISKKDMGSVDMNSVVKTYCENLDGAKMYFTAEEVDEFINRYGKTLDLYLQRGNLTPAFEIYALFKKKVNERTVSNLAALDLPIDLTQPVLSPVDRKKAEWPANQEAPTPSGRAASASTCFRNSSAKIAPEPPRPRRIRPSRRSPRKDQGIRRPPEEALRQDPHLP
ncbi:hypothetical protein EMGBS6_13400 [Opitutia bacterium]|nr:hypothetical protein EMGBS6_13400 [Opitutae bacterium]